MNSLDKMKAVLSPLGFYDLEGSIIEKEISVYGKVLDESIEYFSDMFDECFLQSVSLSGLEKFERMFGSPQTNLSEAQRRENVLYKISMSPVNFTKAQILKQLNIFGYSGLITESAQNQLIILEKIDEEVDISQYKNLIDKIEQILPAQVRFSFDIGSPTWTEFENEDLTFSTLGSYRLHWHFYYDA